MPGHLSPETRSVYSIAATQWIYTPANLSAGTPVQGDYPYSGVLLLQLSREHVFNGQQLFRSSLWLGVIGPAALARQTQSFIHHIVKTTEPNGWQYQLPNYPVVNYEVYHKAALLPPGRAVRFYHVEKVQLGTLLNNVQVGFDLVVSNEKDAGFPEKYIQTTAIKARRCAVYISVMPVLRVVASNSILQGGLLGSRDYYHISASNLERLVLETTITAGIRLRHLCLQYQQVIETRQFTTVHEHVYGDIGLVWRW